MACALKPWRSSKGRHDHFLPEGKPKASIYVFTDVDCGYCQMLHKNVGKMNELGIEVRYLGYPRAGLNTASFNKLASAWCAADKKRL